MGKAQSSLVARNDVLATGHRKRVLGAVRESRERDTSTSPETQRRKITGWTDIHDGDLIHVAVDRDVSGKTVSPWERPDLGDWMAHPEKFDVLCAAKLDRICRNAEDFFRLIRWSKEHSIALVFIEEGFDLTTPAGTMAAKILAVVAEFEWDSIRGRTLDGQQTAIQQGRWRGGVAPYGYRPVKETRNGVLGWYLEIDPDTSAVLREVVGRVILGEESVSKIVEDLNRRTVLTSADAHRVRQGKEPKGSRWHPASLIQLLRSRALLGEYQTADNGTLRDENTSLPLVKAEPLISRAEWTELQEALDRMSRKKLQTRQGTSMLHDVAFCAVCQRKMHHFQSGPRPYYRCSSYNNAKGRCDNSMASAPVLETHLWNVLLSAFGDQPRMEREVVPGEDYSEELAILDEEIANLAGNLAKVKPGSIAAQMTLKRLEERESRREEIASLPSRESQVVYLPTGETLREAYLSWSDSERGKFLRDHEVKIRVNVPKGQAKSPQIDLLLGDITQAYKLASGGIEDSLTAFKMLTYILDRPGISNEPGPEAVRVFVHIGRFHSEN
ncbi:recombinase family protein [Nonomuraea candida]|uniref:recombinase family protein n=1 Tax=Nonomuraea candida TaxID=359159 RepID=UPI000694186B|nr:recombinase family protein [Nonomuraea candida]